MSFSPTAECFFHISVEMARGAQDYIILMAHSLRARERHSPGAHISEETLLGLT